MFSLAFWKYKDSYVTYIYQFVKILSSCLFSYFSVKQTASRKEDFVISLYIILHEQWWTEQLFCISI